MANADVNVDILYHVSTQQKSFKVNKWKTRGIKIFYLL